MNWGWSFDFSWDDTSVFCLEGWEIGKKANPEACVIEGVAYSCLCSEEIRWKKSEAYSWRLKRRCCWRFCSGDSRWSLLIFKTFAIWLSWLFRIGDSFTNMFFLFSSGNICFISFSVVFGLLSLDFLLSYELSYLILFRRIGLSWARNWLKEACWDIWCGWIDFRLFFTTLLDLLRFLYILPTPSRLTNNYLIWQNI